MAVQKSTAVYLHCTAMVWADTLVHNTHNQSRRINSTALRVLSEREEGSSRADREIYEWTVSSRSLVHGRWKCRKGKRKHQRISSQYAIFHSRGEQIHRALVQNLVWHRIKRGVKSRPSSHCDLAKELSREILPTHQSPRNSINAI